MRTFQFIYYLPLDECVGKPASASIATAFIVAENEHSARVAFRSQYKFFTIQSVREIK